MVADTLRPVQFIDERDLAATQSVDIILYRLPLPAAVAHWADHAHGGYCSCIHERGRRMLVLEQDGKHRVERHACGVGADHIEKRLTAILLKYQKSCRNLGY